MPTFNKSGERDDMAVERDDTSITLAIIKVTSGYKVQTAAYRTDFS